MFKQRIWESYFLNNKSFKMSATATLTRTTWAIDPSHSEIQFKVKHLVITTVTGHFKEFSGSVSSGENFEDAEIQFEAKVDSISTNSEQRDAHLKGADFFETDKFPALRFKSAKFVRTGENEFELEGKLTIKGVTRPIKFDVEYTGTAKDPWGQLKAGFELTGKINRKDFGLTWNAVTEAGGALVSEDVKLIANIQLVKQ
jgi:polyisoprenoid-binding protein YceI